MKIRIMLALSSLIAFTFLNVQAQIPRTISFQGVLSTPQGTPKSDGTYTLTFRFYDVSENGSAIWTEQKTLMVKKGLFSTQLGDQVLFGSSVKFDKQYWLSVQVANEAEGSPRIPLSSSAYSLNASSADVAASVKDGSITSAKFATGQVVKSINQLKDDVSLIAGSNVTITPGSNALIISSSGSGGLSGSGVAGRVAFWNASTGLDSDPYLYWDKNTHALGIGTSIPLYPIHSTIVSGRAIYGSASASTGVATGVYGLSGSDNGAGVVGNSTAASGTGTGVFGLSASPGGEGVLGGNSSSAGVNFGVRGYVSSTDGYGVGGISFPTSGLGAGVKGESNSTQGSGVVGSVYPTIGTGNGVLGGSFSTQGTAVYGLSAATSGPSKGVYGVSLSSNGYGIYGENPVGGIAMRCKGWFYQDGGAFWASPTTTFWLGSKPATVKLADGSTAKLFAEEAAEVYFSDYGQARLNAGRTHVELDAKFLQTVTVSDKYPMKVFIQVEDECMGVFVTNKSSTGFDVVELQKGSSNAQFSYRVVCKRRFYEDERLASVEEDTWFNTNMQKIAWPELGAKQNAETAGTKTLLERNQQFLEVNKEQEVFRKALQLQNETRK